MINIIPFHNLNDNNFFILERIELSNPSNYNELHRHNFYEVLWFTTVNSGEYHEVDFEKYIIKPNQIYILSPNQIHTMKIGNKKGYLLAFSKEFFNTFNLPVSLFYRPYFFIDVIDEQTNNALILLMELIETEYNSKKRKNLLEAYCAAFFIQITSLPQNTLKSCPERIIQLLKLIEEHYRTEKEVSFYANILHLSDRRINEISVQHTGKSVKQLIIDRIITEAKRLICLETFTIKEIAFELGFNDPPYFSRLFKQKTLLTPEDFRKQIYTSK